MLRFLIYIVLAICLSIWYLAKPATLSAAQVCHDSLVSANQVVDQIQLSPAIDRQQSSGPNRVIHTATVLVSLEPGLHVSIAGSQDGFGEMVTDDEVKISVFETGQVWEHNFATGPNGAIVPIPPRDLTYLFQGTGTFQVEFETRDLLAPEYRSSEYWLIVWRGCEPTAQIKPPTSTPLPPTPLPPTPIPPTPVPPTPMPTATEVVPVSTSTVVAVGLSPTDTETGTPSPTITPTAVEESTPFVETVAGETSTLWNLSDVPLQLPPWVLGAVLGFLGVIFGAVVWSAALKRDHLQGRIELRDARTGEHIDTYNLAAFHKTEVMMGGNHDIWLPEATGTDSIARIYVRRDGDECSVAMDLFDETNANKVQHTFTLYNGFQMAIGSIYELTYRTEVTDADELETEEQHDEYHV